MFIFNKRSYVNVNAIDFVVMLRLAFSLREIATLGR